MCSPTSGGFDWILSLLKKNIDETSISGDKKGQKNGILRHLTVFYAFWAKIDGVEYCIGYQYLRLIRFR